MLSAWITAMTRLATPARSCARPTCAAHRRGPCRRACRAARAELVAQRTWRALGARPAQGARQVQPGLDAQRDDVQIERQRLQQLPLARVDAVVQPDCRIQIRKRTRRRRWRTTVGGCRKLSASHACEQRRRAPRATMRAGNELLRRHRVVEPGLAQPDHHAWPVPRGQQAAQVVSDPLDRPPHEPKARAAAGRDTCGLRQARRRLRGPASATPASPKCRCPRRTRC